MIQVRGGLEIEACGDIRIYLPRSAINDNDEMEFKATRRYEQVVSAKTPGRIIFDDIAFKADFIRTFDQVKSLIDIRPGHNVLELGAWHGWASVIAKDDCPDAYLVASDLVPECIMHARRYEAIVGRKIDEKWAFSVRDIPFEDEQFDRVFTFASFHHFGDHGDYIGPISQIARILKPSGKLVLLYEPASPALLYKRANKRVNRRLLIDGVEEDVLVASKLEPLARQNGLTLQAEPFPICNFRPSLQAAVYYYLIDKLKITRWLVCTTNMTLEKR